MGKFTKQDYITYLESNISLLKKVISENNSDFDLKIVTSSIEFAKKIRKDDKCLDLQLKYINLVPTNDIAQATTLSQMCEFNQIDVEYIASIIKINL